MKKVLVIVYYWPPSGGAGVQRWLKFVKYLPESGWQPTVITTTNGDYPAIDESLSKEVPAGIKVIQTQTPTFGKLFKKVTGKNSSIPYGSLKYNKKDSLIKKILIWTRINFIIPDARILWNIYAFKAAKRELSINNYFAIITSGPPHSTHLVGLKLKKKYSIKWLADFRDPWTEMGYLKNIKRWKSTELIDKLLEKKAIKNCDTLLAAHQKILDDFGNEEEMHMLTNGFDQEDFENVKREISHEYFCINYFGTIALEANPTSILKGINKLFEKGYQNIRFNFRGKFDHNVKHILQKEDKNDLIKFYPYTSHKETVEKMTNSSLLLLMINNVPNNKGIIPGKIFEYFGSGVEILGIGPEDGDAAKIIKETKCGKMFDYNKIEDITNFIETKYQEWQAGKAFSPSIEIEKYSKINQTKQLAEILEKM